VDHKQDKIHVFLIVVMVLEMILSNVMIIMLMMEMDVHNIVKLNQVMDVLNKHSLMIYVLNVLVIVQFVHHLIHVILV